MRLFRGIMWNNPNGLYILNMIIDRKVLANQGDNFQSLSSTIALSIYAIINKDGSSSTFPLPAPYFKHRLLNIHGDM